MRHLAVSRYYRFSGRMSAEFNVGRLGRACGTSRKIHPFYQFGRVLGCAYICCCGWVPAQAPGQLRILHFSRLCYSCGGTSNQISREVWTTGNASYGRGSRWYCRLGRASLLWRISSSSHHQLMSNFAFAGVSRQKCGQLVNQADSAAFGDSGLSYRLCAALPLIKSLGPVISSRENIVS